MNDITFVISGPVSSLTYRCAESIKFFFEKSSVVLTTWKGSSVDQNYFDHVLFLDDPGVYGDNPRGAHANLYRMLYSTAIGIHSVKTEFVVRVRPDFFFVNDNLKFIKFTKSNNGAFKIFDKRIIGLNYFFRNPLFDPLLYHIGDIFHYGKTSDMKKLWSREIFLRDEQKQTVYYFDLDKNIRYRYFSEQYIWIKLLKNFGYKTSTKYQTDLNSHDYYMSEHSIAENFDIYNSEELGLFLPEKFRMMSDASLYTMADLNKIRESDNRFYFHKKWRHQLKKTRRAVKYFFGFGRIRSTQIDHLF